MASTTEIFPCCLQSCCGLKQCKISGGVNNLNVSPIACNLVVAWNLVVFSHVVASITSIFSRCLQSCCIFTHCTTIGGLPGILLYSHTWPDNWWLQSFKFPPVAWNPAVSSHIAQLWVACLESCCILTHGQITGGFNN